MDIMKLFSKKGQISLEMSLLILAVLIGSVLVGYELLKTNTSTNSLSVRSIKNTTMKGFADWCIWWAYAKHAPFRNEGIQRFSCWIGFYWNKDEC